MQRIQIAQAFTVAAFLHIPSVFATPQVTVTPSSLSLGYSNVAQTDIVIEGSDFPTTEPGDTVLVTFYGPNSTQLPLATTAIKPDGSFKASVNALIRIMEILRADVRSNENLDSVIVVSRPTIPAGQYTVKAESVLTGVVAESKFEFKARGIGNKMKDWIGKLKGKIEYK